ncbi:MAG: serine/threonine dehydratase [Acidimicrobiia bacterium]
MPGELEVTRSDIEAAAVRIDGFVRVTPILELGDVLGGGFNLGAKLDYTQPTGSFKVRGAFSLLRSREPAQGVAAASGGNFGMAIAYACSKLGYAATIFVPETSPPQKIDRIGQYGADVRKVAGYYDDALAECEAFVADSGAFMAHAYDQPEVVAGQGTAAREIVSQDPTADTILVAVGGGGLIAGIASWCRDDTKVVAVEPFLCPSFSAAKTAGQPVPAEVGGVASSSLGASTIGSHCWAARSWIDDSVLVGEDDILEAQAWLWAAAKLAVEPSAATTIAALRSGAYRPATGEHVVVMLSGANFDPGSLS